MLQLLKESVSSRHAERLEQVVIVLIAIEIGTYVCPLEMNSLPYLMICAVLGIVTILVDLIL